MQDLFPAAPQHISGYKRYRAIAQNWDYSLEVLTELRRRLAAEDLPGVSFIALAGSFARLEGSNQSDADCIVVVERNSRDSHAAQEVLKGHLTQMELPEPNSAGVFVQARCLEELVPRQEAGDMGAPDEPADVLSKRMLMLLESRPVYGDDAYNDGLAQILDRCESYVSDDPSKEHLFLLNHLIHYFRYICINYESSFHRQNDKWPLRNLKLRHSRLVMYMGLLVLIGEASKYTDERKATTLAENLHLPPLERIAKVYGLNGDSSFFRVAGLYNTFLARISDENTRRELNRIDYADRYDNVLFSALKANSDALQAELTRFILGRRGAWSERFFEYLIF